MRATRHIVGFAMLVLALGILIVASIWVRVTRIDATESRLMVDYWQLWLGCLLTIIVGLILVADA